MGAWWCLTSGIIGFPVCPVRRGVGAHCWGSEESDPPALLCTVLCSVLWRGWCVWGFGSRLELVCRGVGGSGVGLLFEIWIVDASIFVVCCVHCLVWFIVGDCFWALLVFWSSSGGWGSGGVLLRFLVVGWAGGVCDKL